jgi:large subunit ribosomal protein L25
MEKIILEKRDIIGKKNRNLLKEDLTPCVIYNSKGESNNIQIDSTIAKRIQNEATSTTIYDAELDGKSIKVLVKEIDTNPITDELRHISFFGIDENKEMVFTVPFEFVGISPAVKNNLGVLVQAMDDIEVKCKLADLKPFIEIDISGLEHPGQSIAVNDITLPQGMHLINDEFSKSTIVTITELIKEEEVVAPVAAEGEELADGETPAEGEVPAEGETPTTEETPKE